MGPTAKIVLSRKLKVLDIVIIEENLQEFLMLTFKKLENEGRLGGPFG